MSPEIGIRIVSTLDDFLGVASEWDELVASMARPSPFLLHGWLVAWWRHYGHDKRLAVVVAHRSGQLVGAVPLAIQRRHGVDVAGFIGGSDAGPVDVLVASGSGADETVRALAAAIVELDCGLLDFFGLPQGSRLERSLPSLTLIERLESPVLLMPDGFDVAYRTLRSARRRKQDRRRLTKLQETHTVEFNLAASEPALATALDQAFEIHARRWQGRNDRSGFSDREGREFHRRALGAVTAAAEARILVMTIDGNPSAFQYWLILGTTMVGCRRGFDPEYAEHSPGLLTMIRALELAGAEGVTRVDFLGGGERYKLEFASRLEPLYQGVGYPKGARAHAAFRARLVLTRLRQRARRFETLRRLYAEHGALLHRGR